MDWHFVHALPNLSLPSGAAARPPLGWPSGIDLGSGMLAIVPGADERVAAIRSRVPAVDQILRSFRDQLGKPYSASVLIANDEAINAKWFNEEAIVAFRNAIALGLLMKGRAAVVRGRGGMSPTWSETFDFHPAQLTSTNRVVLYSPALTAAVSPGASLNFSHSPYVPLEGRYLFPDNYLFRVLAEEWNRRYRHAGDDQFSRSLFRSLEVAYTACGVGAKNEGSIHDYGLQVALWVSAIEILAWPPAKHSDLQEVLRLLGCAPLDPRLKRRVYQVKLKKREAPRRLNALERAYSYLHMARNNFLHGNPVTEAALLTRGKKTASPTPRIAAIVYRAALVAYLNEKYPVTIKTFQDARQRPGEIGEQSAYDQALAELFGRNLMSV